MIENIVSGTIGGILVLCVQWIYDHTKVRKNNKEESIIQSKFSKKEIGDSILLYLNPGKSLKKCFEILGSENSYSNSEHSHLTEKFYETNSYLFILKNGMIKLTSEDNKTIDSITIMADFKKHKFNFCNDSVNKSIVRSSTNHFSFNSAKEIYFGIETYYGALGRYLNITYFGCDIERIRKYEKKKKIKKLKDAEIDQICFSRISNFAPYISDSELQNV